MILEHNSQMPFYRSPFGALTCDSKVKIRLSAKNAGIPHSVKLILQREGENESSSFNMAYIMTVMDSSVYETELLMPKYACLLWYYFEVKNAEGTFYYGNNLENLGGLGRMYDEIPTSKYQITVYSKDFKTPEWFSKSIAYQIFPDRFYNANADGSFLGNRTDIIKRNWDEKPFYKAEQFGGEYLANDFFGGNLEGIIKKLPYLKELGITTVYLNPIFKAFSNHKYDTGDYEKIDEMFGTEETFKNLCKTAEKNGIKIILDGVFNHTGSNSKYFNKNGEYESVGAYNSKDSLYYDWFCFSNHPEEYDCWWGMKTLPNVNEKSESYRDYILNGENSIVKKWLKNGASGWRLDVADELPGFFLKELRKAVKSEKSDAVIIGEVWEDASNKISYDERREYFLGYELDSVMNYPLKNILIRTALGEASTKDLDRVISSLRENYPKPAFYSLLNMLSSHDSERVLTVLGDAPKTDDREFQSKFVLDEASYKKAQARLQAVVGSLMLLPGVPCIYYGDEVGMQGYRDPFSRESFRWELENSENEVLKIYKRFIKIRKSSDCFSLGELKTVYAYGSVYGFLREKNDERFIVLVNFGENYENIRLDIGELKTEILKNAENDEEIYTSDGIFYLGLSGYEVKIYKA